MTDVIVQVIANPPAAVMLLSIAPATYFFFLDMESSTKEESKKFVAFLCPIIVFGVTFVIARFLPSEGAVYMRSGEAISPWWPSVAISTACTCFLWLVTKKKEAKRNGNN